MAETPPYLPRHCLQGHEVRKLFAINYDEKGRLILRSSYWLQEQRDGNKIPFIRFNKRLIMYPRDKIEALITEANKTVTPPQ